MKQPHKHAELIKPEPKPDVVRNMNISIPELGGGLGGPNVRLTFDGETGKLKKAEVLE